VKGLDSFAKRGKKFKIMRQWGQKKLSLQECFAKNLWLQEEKNCSTTETARGLQFRWNFAKTLIFGKTTHHPLQTNNNSCQENHLSCQNINCAGRQNFFPSVIFVKDLIKVLGVYMCTLNLWDFAKVCLTTAKKSMSKFEPLWTLFSKMLPIFHRNFIWHVKT